MRILLIDNGTDTLELLIDYFRRRQFDYDIVGPRYIPLDKISDYGLIILSGGVWYDDLTERSEYYRQELDLIMTSQVPILGICLGMLLITEAHGGELVESGHRFKGGRFITLTDSGAGLMNLPRKFEVWENHTISVSRVPDDFEVLGTSETCVEIIKHRDRAIIGVQFHPENTDSSLVDAVWGSLFQLLGLPSSE